MEVCFEDFSTHGCLVNPQIFAYQNDLHALELYLRTSALFVAAKTITFELVPKPSISVSGVQSIFSFIITARHIALPLALPTSISSMK
jgi:hypothetical protein